MASPTSTSSASTSNPDAGPLDRRTKVIAGVIIIGALMSILDATVVNVALNTLSQDLASPLTTIQWIISGYTLALAATIPLSGWAADRYGAKRVWLVAVVMFTGASVLCALAWSAEALIAFRVLQGFGGGLLTPVGTILIARAAGPNRMGRVMSLMGVPLLLGPVLGPVLGGVLLQSASWRWIFLINVPIGALAVGLGLRLLPSDQPGQARELDLPGLLLLSPGLAALIYGVSETRSISDLGSASVALPLVAAVLLVASFVRRSLRLGERSLLDVRLFGDRTFASASVTTFALGTATFGSTLLLPLYYQRVRGEDVLTTGLLITPQALGMGIAMSFSGRLSDRFGAGWVVPFGLALALAAQFGLTHLGAETSFWAIGGILIVLGLGLGSSMMPAMSAAYSRLDRAAVSRATPELQIVQRVGSALGSAAFAVILAQRIVAAGSEGRDPARLAEAFSGTYWWAMALTALAFVPAFLLPRRHLNLRAAPAAHSHALAGNSGLVGRRGGD